MSIFGRKLRNECLSRANEMQQGCRLNQTTEGGDSVLLAFIIYSYLMPAALAEPVPFSCTILPDGKSMRVAISNPFDRETSC
jgi:hypothetical protein